MSSLAATQADGYYVPPEYYESGQYKHKSKNQFAGSKGHNQYLQKGLVRFELPYDGFCMNCGEHVGKGTRFNAHKKEAGNYFSTKIWEFRMKCRVCGICEFVIRTNPKERGFDYVTGIHKQVQEFNTKDAGTAGFIDTEYGNKLVTEGSTSGEVQSALSNLETVASGHRKALTERDELQKLMKDNAKTKFDDAGSNAAIRANFRVERRGRKRRLKEATARGWRAGMELADSTQDDLVTARSMTFRHGKQVETESFRKLRSSSIFASGNNMWKKDSRRRSRRKDQPPQPDPISSLSSDVVAKSETFENPVPVVRARRRIRVAPRGSSVLQVSRVVAPSETGQEETSSLVALADYDSDDDS